MKKLIFKEDKIGKFNYIGFRKYVGKIPCLSMNIYGNILLIKTGEYIALGFVNKPDIENWNNEINIKELETGEYDNLINCGKFDEIRQIDDRENHEYVSGGHDRVECKYCKHKVHKGNFCEQCGNKLINED